MLRGARQQDRPLGQGLRGEGEGGAGGNKLAKKSKKEAKHTQGVFEGKGKEKAVEKRKLPSSEEGNEAQKQQHGEGKKAKTGE